MPQGGSKARILGGFLRCTIISKNCLWTSNRVQGNESQGWILYKCNYKQPGGKGGGGGGGGGLIPISTTLLGVPYLLKHQRASELVDTVDEAYANPTPVSWFTI